MNNKTTIYNKLKHLFYWILFDLLGFQFIREKLRLPWEDAKHKPSTLIFWLAGIYATLYGMSLARYELSSSRLEVRASSYYSLLGGSSPQSALILLPELQQSRLPYPPDILRPKTIARSFFEDSVDQQFVHELMSSAIAVAQVSEISEGRPLFSEITSQGLNFESQNLGAFTLANISIPDSSFQNTNFTNTIKINESDLSKSNFSEAIVRIESSNTSLRNSSFENSQLQHLELTYFNPGEEDEELYDLIRYALDSVVFRGSSYGALILRSPDHEVFGSDFSELNRLSPRSFAIFDTEIIDSSFARSDLTRARFRGNSLRGVDFSSANLSSVEFSRSELESVRFDHAYLENVKFTQTEINTKSTALSPGYEGPSSEYRLHFRGAVMPGSSFERSVVFANFDDAILKDAVFLCTVVINSSFVGADLRGVDFTNSILDANFTDARFDDAVEQLSKAYRITPRGLSEEQFMRLEAMSPNIFDDTTDGIQVNLDFSARECNL